ncbi:uncharacterized protein MONOS_6873 [Monocercomonoides exilis]|uniref:uncharacterized protein n=1 Tax=Monocercomonoides exilis TaxID=2049356 RepID=UPI0035596FC8|nr:hypothetical protein MONOS_6873 [Monocercomonoides exilis]
MINFLKLILIITTIFLESEDPEVPDPTGAVTIYVGQNGASDANGEAFDTPVDTLNKANTLLTGNAGDNGYHIKVIATGKVPASEAVAFDKEKGITVVGVTKQENDDGTEIETEAKATIVCSIENDVDLFTCTHTVEFREISFEFGRLIGTNSLIHATTASTSLSLISCDFVRPTPQKSGRNDEGGEPQALGTTLMKVEAGTLTMETVIGTASNNPALFLTSPFLITGVTEVSLKSLQMSEITSKTGPVMKIVGGSGKSIAVTLDGCGFSLCKSEEASADIAKSGTLYVESDNSESTFTIRDTVATTFTSCTCAHGKSGGIYLKMNGIEDATKFTWPSSEKLTFTGCTAGTDNTVKNTGLYLEVKTSVIEAIATDMHGKFASGYKRGQNDWVVTALGDQSANEIDFTSTYFDPEVPDPTGAVTIYVGQNGASDANGEAFDTPVDTLNKANTLLTGNAGDNGYHIKVIATGKVPASEAVAFDKEKGITVVGVTKQENDDGTEIETEAKATIVCSIENDVDLFTCTHTVEFREISFEFGRLIGTNSLIHATTASTSLSLISCDFVRPTPQKSGRNDEGGEPQALGTTLMKVEAGTLTMETVIGTASNNPALFLTSPFLITGVTEVSLKSLQMSEITSKTGPVMKIVGGSGKSIAVTLDGCGFSLCKSEEASADIAKSGTLYVESDNSESTFTIRDTVATTFTSCTCAHGKSGGIYLKMNGIEDATKFTWPSSEKLTFTGCTAGTDNTVKNTGLYLEVKTSVIEAIATDMHGKFASGYKRGQNDWVVTALGDQSANEIDFTSTYFDPEVPDPTGAVTIYVGQNGASDANGEAFDTPVDTLNKANTLLTGNAGDNGYHIKVIATGKVPASEAVAFDKEKGITVVGVTKQENDDGTEIETEAKATIVCSIENDVDLFTCTHTVEFREISFEFGRLIGTNSLIHATTASTSLSLISCDFVRPTPQKSGRNDEGGEPQALGTTLMKVEAGTLTMETVIGTASNNPALFLTSPFLITGVTEVSLKSLQMSEITSKTGPVMKIVGGSGKSIAVTLDGCGFSLCKSEEASADIAKSGTLYVESDNSESTFTIRDTVATTFTSCTCAHGKSGGIYLKMNGIEDATKFTWPSSEKLTFTGCTAGTDNTVKNTGLYLEVKTSVIEAIATDMHGKFASGYKRGQNDWVVTALGDQSANEIDFTSTYFDPEVPDPTGAVTIYVGQNGASDANGEAFDTPVDTLNKANTLLTGNAGDNGYHIKVIATGKVPASEAVAFDKEKGITVVGVTKQENDDGTEIETEAKATIVCSIENDVDLFTCTHTVEFREISFEFGRLIGTNSLIHATTASTSLSLISCDFVRPTPQKSGRNDEGGEPQALGTTLMKVEAGTLTMETVIGTASNNPALFLTSPFLITGVTEVSLKSLQMSEITSKTGPVMKIVGGSGKSIAVTLDGCGFSLCKSEEASADIAKSGTLYVESDNSESTFTIRDTVATTFTSCTCAHGKSGGIYLKMNGIEDATKFTWPSSEKLTFTGCTAGTDNTVKNTGLYLEVKTSVIEAIATDMHGKFASGYKRGQNDWVVTAFGDAGVDDIDFTAEYFDVSVERYLKSDGLKKNDGLSFENPSNSLIDMYRSFKNDVKKRQYSMKIIKSANAFKVDFITFSVSQGINIVGIEKEDGIEVNKETLLNCDIHPGGNLFTCKQTVTFKYLAFIFPNSLDVVQKINKNFNADPFALIYADSESESLTLSNCRFVRPTTGSQGRILQNVDGSSSIAINLVKASKGSIYLDSVSCSDEKEKVTFNEPLIDINGANKINLKGVDISKVDIVEGAAINIEAGESVSCDVKVEGLKMNEISSKKSKTAGLLIDLKSDKSKVEIGRSEKCSFKSCATQEGKSGAIYIEMKKATSNLALPTENNLEIDETNSAGSSSTSLCIIAPDFDEFSKQNGAFDFAKNYNDSNAGWVVGASDPSSDPDDVYEKYVKKSSEDPNPDEKEKPKTKTAVIVVAVVVPIVFVIAVVVIIIVVVVIVRRRRRSKYSENSDDEKDNEIEMSAHV